MRDSLLIKCDETYFYEREEPVFYGYGSELKRVVLIVLSFL